MFVSCVRSQYPFHFLDSDPNVTNTPHFNPSDSLSGGPIVSDPDPDVDMDPVQTPRPSMQTLFNMASKRMRSPSLELGPSVSRASKKARQMLSRQCVKPKSPADWHLKKGEVPADSVRKRRYVRFFLASSYCSFHSARP